MIPQLRTAIFNYLTSEGNPFITLLGDGNLSHKHPLNNKAYPFCAFAQSGNTRSIDSGDKFEHVELTFRIYDGSNDGVKESFISADNIEALTVALDDMLDLKDASIPITDYLFNRIKRKSIINAPTKSSSVHGVILKYDILLQKTR